MYVCVDTYIHIISPAAVRSAPAVPPAIGLCASRGRVRVRANKGPRQALDFRALAMSCAQFWLCFLVAQNTSTDLHTSPHTSAYVSRRQHTSAYVSTRPHTSAYVRPALLHNLKTELEHTIRVCPRQLPPPLRPPPPTHVSSLFLLPAVESVVTTAWVPVCVYIVCI